jgi:hypothetical protein
MTLRIFEEANEVETVIALHGWLSAAEVSELERLAAAHDGPLRVDLAHLMGVTRKPSVLMRLRGRGVLAGASPFVELLLERAGDPEGEVED